VKEARVSVSLFVYQALCGNIFYFRHNKSQFLDITFIKIYNYIRIIGCFICETHIQMNDKRKLRK